MSRYTEAEFAACLLQCGPHTRMTRVHTGNHQLESFTAASNVYRDRVYRYFLKYYPGITAHHFSTSEHVASSWRQFWQSYLKWVES